MAELRRHRVVCEEQTPTTCCRAGIVSSTRLSTLHRVVLTSWEQALDQLDEDADENLGAAVASSLSLAMGLTTILTTIWVCPPKYA